MRTWWGKIKNHPRLIKVFNWEFWPTTFFWVPVLIRLYPLEVIRNRNFGIVASINPAILMGGLGFESKFKTMELIPKHLKPITLLYVHGSNISDFIDQIDQGGISYPLIAKPDIGFRGFFVKKISSPQELESYLSSFEIDFVIQEFIETKTEFGIFYHCFPNKKKGEITSITTKEFLTITGNGKDTIQKIMENDSRYQLYLDYFIEQSPQEMRMVLNKGKKFTLGEIGNHCKGTKFLNGQHLIDDELTAIFDKLVGAIDGVYYGRFDIKAESIDAIKNGDYKILEMNGSFSEPTHIYDPEKSSYFKALRVLKEHVATAFKIANINNQRGFHFSKSIDFFKFMQNYFKHKNYLLDLEKGETPKSIPFSHYK